MDEVEGAVGGEATATVYAAKTDEDDEDKEIAPATPYIIINQYSYGNDQIEAGNEFQLDISFHNTSADIQVENIVMTVTPPEDLTVASSSNTVFIPFLEAGGTLSHTIALKAKASAEATSHSVQISFNYDYIDTVNEERKSVTERSEEIAIPVTQIDRFSVDPITESPYAVVGEETYLTVSFINRGKSITYNISGIVRCDDAVSAPSQHFGNLEAGKAETLDFYLTGSEAGVYNGDIVIQYEDENNNQKEISTPFTFTVDELPVYEPPYIPDEEWEEPQPPGPGALSIVLFVLGGLAIAAPIALYLMKLVKEKGKEDFDEDF